MTAEWIEPRGWPALAAGEVHVWLAHVPSARGRLAQLAALLSEDERERAARFRFELHRERSQIARGMLRFLLGQYIGCEARALTFCYNPHGKPELKERGWHFNTSHSGDYAAVAITRVAATGVDIEQIRLDAVHSDAIAQRHFAPGEQQQLSAIPQAGRAEAFFQFWTRKEAFVKARGDGLFSGLDRFEVSLNGAALLSVAGQPATNWWISSLPIVPGYAGAVVVNTATCTPKFWRWTNLADTGCA
jgi:4'-phosphopantetheinyl transferase